MPSQSRHDLNSICRTRVLVCAKVLRAYIGFYYFYWRCSGLAGYAKPWYLKLESVDTVCGGIYAFILFLPDIIYIEHTILLYLKTTFFEICFFMFSFFGQIALVVFA